MSQKTVTINGKEYDAHTGMPLGTAPVHGHAKPSQAIHRTPQKSQTLNRHVVHKTAPAQSAVIPARDLPAITKFAPHPQAVKPRRVTDIGPSVHPMVAKAQHRKPHATPVIHAAPKPAQIIKQEAIADALAKAPSHHAAHTQFKQPKKYSRPLSIASASLALLLLGGYFTYINMPSLSVRVAASQAGVAASYPEYRPDGYGLGGPVAYSQGQVILKFTANAGPQSYTLTQAKSGWDSSAVLDNYVKEKAGSNYVAYNERGLTIYTFDGNAAWVNGGVLYTIAGDAPLSSDQIRRIATSI